MYDKQNYVCCVQSLLMTNILSKYIMSIVFQKIVFIDFLYLPPCHYHGQGQVEETKH